MTPDIYADPDYLAFVKAMRACPEDNTIRLACADRLQELGDDVWAEFVRVQMALSSDPANRAGCRIVPCRYVLTRPRRTSVPLVDFEPRAHPQERVVNLSEMCCEGEIDAAACHFLPTPGDVVTLIVPSPFGRPAKLLVPEFMLDRITTTGDGGLSFVGAVLSHRTEYPQPSLRLIERHVELWRQIASRTLVTVGATPYRIDGSRLQTWERGFVTAVTCAFEGWSEIGDSLLDIQPIRTVRLTSRPQHSPLSSTGESTYCTIAGRRVDMTEAELQDACRGHDVTNPRTLEVVFVLLLLGKRWPNITFTTHTT